MQIRSQRTCEFVFFVDVRISPTHKRSRTLLKQYFTQIHVILREILESKAKSRYIGINKLYFYVTDGISLTSNTTIYRNTNPLHSNNHSKISYLNYYVTNTHIVTTTTTKIRNKFTTLFISQHRSVCYVAREAKKKIGKVLYMPILFINLRKAIIRGYEFLDMILSI